MTVLHQKPFQSPGYRGVRQQFWQLEEQRAENQADLSSWHCPGRHTSRQTSTRRSTVSSSKVKSGSCRVSQPQLHPPGQMWLREGSGGLLLHGKQSARHAGAHSATSYSLAKISARESSRGGRGCPKAGRAQQGAVQAAHHSLTRRVQPQAPGTTSSSLAPCFPPAAPEERQGHIRRATGCGAALFVSDEPGGADERESVSVITTNAAH